MIQIKRPAFIVDKQKCLSNIRKMAAKAAESHVIFRPHFKTHQSPVIAGWFRDLGIDKITVSSVDMAKTFAMHGWKDITIAFPVNYLQIGEINRLSGEIHLNLLVESRESLQFLQKQLLFPAGIFIEIDAGYPRSGVSHHNHSLIGIMLHELKKSPVLDFKGFLVHAGNTYQAGGPEEIRSIFKESTDLLNVLKDHYSTEFPDLILSYGDTPSCSIIDDFRAVDEVRPGNFVFYDLMQSRLGSCHTDEIAAVVACPVVAKNDVRTELVIYGGAVHLSKESLPGPGGTSTYGLVVRFDDHGWGKPLAQANVISLSQEHGIIRTGPEIFTQVQRGDVLGIIPVHSCLANDLLMDHTLVINERY